MLAGTVLFVVATYLIMLLSYHLSKFHKIHIPIMVTIIVIDVCFPFYLFMTRDWYKRLIDEQEIFSFLIWMHLILVITLYILYVVQIMVGRRLLKGEEEARIDHKAQAKGILIARGLVILTGALLVDPVDIS